MPILTRRILLVLSIVQSVTRRGCIANIRSPCHIYRTGPTRSIYNGTFFANLITSRLPYYRRCKRLSLSARPLKINIECTPFSPWIVSICVYLAYTSFRSGIVSSHVDSKITPAHGVRFAGLRPGMKTASLRVHVREQPGSLVCEGYFVERALMVFNQK